MTKAAELAKMGEVLTNSQIGGRRNLIINGAMQINQRGSVTFNHAETATANVYGCDRFQFQSSNLDELEGTLTQVADAPTGFTNSLKWTTTTKEDSIASDETFDCCQKIEAQDLQQLLFGTSSAKKLTLRFYVKSSRTGTFGINVFKADSTARQLTSTYTISSADTWEEKTIIIPADTDSGATIANDNGEGLRITWHLGTGSGFNSANTALTWTNYADAGWAYGHTENSVATTVNATWQLTGVQLEVGEYNNPTPFEHRSFGDELALCQRYCFRINDNGTDNIQIGAGYYVTTTTCRAVVTFPVTMRGIPAVTTVDAALGILRANVVDNSITLSAVNNASVYSTGLNIAGAATDTIGEGIVLRLVNGNSGFLEAEAEL